MKRVKREMAALAEEMEETGEDQAEDLELLVKGMMALVMFLDV